MRGTVTQFSDEVEDEELNHDGDEFDDATILCDESADDEM